MDTNIFRTGAHYAASYWWAWIFRGVIAILFGIAIFVRPVMSTGVLILLFGAFAFAGGVLALITGVSTIGENKYWWAMIAEGFIGLAVAFITFVWPGITALALVLIIGIWAIVSGVLAILGAFSKEVETSNKALQILGGVLSIILGLILLSTPGIGLLTIVWVLGIYGIIYGISQIAHGFQLNRLEHLIHSTQ